MYPNAIFRGIDVEPSQVERYNHIAEEFREDSDDRMRAVQGDLLDSSPDFRSPEWSDFDVVAVSMALHHIVDTVEILTLLRERLRPGGVLLVVEFLSSADPASNLQEGHGSVSQDVVENNGIRHIGFTSHKMKAALTAAGCNDVRIKIHPEAFALPEDIGGEQRLFLCCGYTSVGRHQ